MRFCALFLKKRSVTMRDSDFPGAFQALATKLDEFVRGGLPSWLAITPPEGQHTPLVGLIESSTSWRPGDDIPVALMVRRLSTKPATDGELIVGFVRLNTVPAPTELRLKVGGNDFGTVTMGGDSGSFVFAHADRFMVPCGVMQEVHVQTDEPRSLGIVWAILDNPERFDLLELLDNGACPTHDGTSVTYVSVHDGDEPEPVKIPDMRDLLWWRQNRHKRGEQV